MKVLFATGNPGKLREVQAIFEPLGFEVQQLVDEYPEIQADTLEEVVASGLRYLFEHHRMPIIIDDSGLFIETLGGFPGVYSAYVFKTLGCKGILKQMEHIDNRRAEFRCCAGYVDKNGQIYLKTGSSQGSIIHEKRGKKGFGYDPIFVPDEHDLTFAELDMESKNKISHRGRAFEALASILKEL